MPYSFTDAGLAMQAEVQRFLDDHIYPNEAEYHEQCQEVGPRGYPPIMDKLKAAARERGLWNLFLPHLAPDAPGTKLSNLDYAPISEQLGKTLFASEALNCSAPDTGNMEILNLYGSERIKQAWLTPLLEGEIRSAFCMTEPESASSDATNIQLRIERDGGEYVLNGRKWFSSGALADRCKVFIVMGKTDPKASAHLQQSMIVVPKDTPGISIGRSPQVFGYVDMGGHPEVIYDNVRVPVDNLLGEEGGGFALSQARLGPGRIHHCMRALGVAERALEYMVRRSLGRTTFGTLVAQKGLIQDWIADSRIEIDMAREYVLRTAHLMDTVGNKAAATEISGIKVAIPNITLKVIDRAIQVHGAAGVTQFFPLAEMYAHARTLRIVDGPDEVHKMTIARREIRKYAPDFRRDLAARRHHFAVLPRPGLGVSPQPLQLVELAGLVEHHVDHEVAEVHQHPPGVIEALDAERGRSTGLLDALLHLLGDRPHLPGVGPAGDDEGVGDGQNRPNRQDDAVLTTFGPRGSGGHRAPVSDLIETARRGAA
jgi:acyl-CoA dehydrogenase